jgi:AAA domain
VLPNEDQQGANSGMTIHFLDPQPLPPIPVELRQKFYSLEGAMRAAPSSEKPAAVRRFTQYVAGMTCEAFPLEVAIERVWASAEQAGLLVVYDEDQIQREIAAGSREPIAPLEGELDFASEAAVTAPRLPSWRDHLVGAQDLCDRIFDPVKWLVPGLFPEGVTLLVGRPKICKSWMLLQVGSAVARGVGTLVSADEPSFGDVLYLSLEDNDRRVQRRMTKHHGARRESWPKRLAIVTAWRRLDDGGLQDLREWCTSVPTPALIVVDTLKRVRPPKRSNQSDYDADYAACEGLIKLAHEFPGLGLIVAHHDRKMGADDVFDTVSGTLGLTAGVDTIAILKRSGQGVTLHIQGRDLEEDVEKAVRFDRETCLWTVLGEAAEVHRSGDRTRVLEALRGAAGEALSVAELMAEAQVRSRDAGWQLLHRMAEAGEIVRRGRGKYVLPGTPMSRVSGSKDGAQTTDGTRLNCDQGDPDTPDKGAKA